MGQCVIQDWIFNLPFQQQSVLLLGCRGPDGIAKFHPSKEIVLRYRATILKAAYWGRPMVIDEKADTFMSLEAFTDNAQWSRIVRTYLRHIDEMPHHHHMHLMHGAEIIGYKHPDKLFRDRFFNFYMLCVHDLHLNMETEEEMDERLNDWGMAHWEQPAPERPLCVGCPRTPPCPDCPAWAMPA